VSTNYKAKWRGIKTTQKAKHENEPKTVRNRFGQLTLSLPRIDDHKRWAGYPGITGVSRKIARLVPNCLYYVEAFAGTAKVFQELMKRSDVNIQECILNDTSDFIYHWLKKELGQYATITKTDFTKCIERWDSKNTFFLFDPAWFKTYYEQSFSSFNRDSVETYSKELIEICKTIKGKFIITTRRENKIMLKSGFTNRLVKSEYVVSGKYPRVLITTNLDPKGVRV
jgi:hypothetical protein